MGDPEHIDRRRVEMLLKAHLKTIAPDDEKGVVAIDEHGGPQMGQVYRPRRQAMAG